MESTQLGQRVDPRTVRLEGSRKNGQNFGMKVLAILDEMLPSSRTTAGKYSYPTL